MERFQKGPEKTFGRKPGVVSAAALPPKQARFVEEYLIDLNGKRSAIRAGYAENSAEVRASQLLRKLKVAAAVKEGMKKREARTFITQDKVLKETALLAFSCVNDYLVDDDGNVSLAPGAPEGAMRAISSIKRKIRVVGQGEAAMRIVDVELRLWDKPTPLKLGGRHVGLFPNEVKADMGEDTLAGILARAAARGLNGK